MLPSQAGRTTMCPTEIFYDAAADGPYLQLLPIDSRLDERSLTAWRKAPEAWQRFALDDRHPDAMAALLAKVTETREVETAAAVQLGFDPEQLEQLDSDGLVSIPAWRHALISIDHPLLRQGLRILDTPGLNALGAEPELTLSLLPHAQAVLFLIGADTGVTASDLALWEQCVKPSLGDAPERLFAVMNKIDSLWDDLGGVAHVAQSLENVRQASARQLALPAEHILPLSAKQALLGKVRGDLELLARSQLDSLEQLLAERIVAPASACCSSASCSRPVVCSAPAGRLSNSAWRPFAPSTRNWPTRSCPVPAWSCRPLARARSTTSTTAACWICAPPRTCWPGSASC